MWPFNRNLLYSNFTAQNKQWHAVKMNKRAWVEESTASSDIEGRCSSRNMQESQVASPKYSLDSDHRTDQRKHRCVFFVQDFRKFVTQALWSMVSAVEKTDNATISSPYQIVCFWLWHERSYLDTFTMRCRQVSHSRIVECTQNTGSTGLLYSY